MNVERIEIIERRRPHDPHRMMWSAERELVVHDLDGTKSTYRIGRDAWPEEVEAVLAEAAEAWREKHAGRCPPPPWRISASGYWDRPPSKRRFATVYPGGLIR